MELVAEASGCTARTGLSAQAAREGGVASVLRSSRLGLALGFPAADVVPALTFSNSLYFSPFDEDLWKETFLCRTEQFPGQNFTSCKGWAGPNLTFP